MFLCHTFFHFYAVKLSLNFQLLLVSPSASLPRIDSSAEPNGSLSRTSLSGADVCLSHILFLFLFPADTNYLSTLPHLCSKNSHPSSGLPW